MYLEERIAKINDELRSLEGKTNIAIWGAAENTVKLFQYTDIIKYNIKTIIDNGKYGQAFFGKLILPAYEVDWNKVDAVVISSFYREDEIFMELTEKYHFAGTIIRLRQEGQQKPFYQSYMKAELQVPIEYSEEIKKNAKFHNIHQGEKIFIIGNGPSIKETDLTKIKDARKMVVSNFYLHKDYKIVNPDYYCFAQFTYHDALNKDFYNDWIYEIGEKSGNPQFFFNVSEKSLVDQCRSFMGKKVNYMYLDRLNADYYDEVDMTSKMMMGQSVPIDCIQIAIYMGFKEIYLVGIEHDFMLNNSYSYFYNRKKSLIGDKDKNWVNEKNEVIVDFQSKLIIASEMWKEYALLKRISDCKGIKIYNATKGGILDVFERVEYDSII